MTQTEIFFFHLQGYFDVTNEPGQQIPFMYHYANLPGKSAQRSRQAITQFFNTSVNGLPGNDGNTPYPFQSYRLSPLITRLQSYYQTAAQWAASWSSTSPDCTLFQQRSSSSSPPHSSRACHSSTHSSTPRRPSTRRTFRRRRYSSRCVAYRGSFQG